MKIELVIRRDYDGLTLPILDMEAENESDRRLLINLYRKAKRNNVTHARECWKSSQQHYSCLSLWLRHKGAS